MSVMPYATVVGVFRIPADADLAVKALLRAGFEETKIRCFQESSGVSLLDAFKGFLEGVSPDDERLIRKLTDMKLTEEEALYFSDEYARGSAILAVKTQGDDAMAVNILHQYGARP
ncbi:MAG TPA: hypothetical protein VF458_13205 [Ktedonobacteraceae bacterium]